MKLVHGPAVDMKVSFYAFCFLLWLKIISAAAKLRTKTFI